MKCNLLPPLLCTSHWQALEGGIILDERRNETYNSDSKELISFKCTGVFIANPLRVTVLVIAAFAKAFFLLFTPLFKALSIYIKGIEKGLSLKEIRADLGQAFSSWTLEMKQALFSPVFTLFYGPLIQVGALIGILDPLKGRKMIALLETKWGELDLLLEESTTLAPCFKPRPYHRPFFAPYKPEFFSFRS